MTLGWLFAMMGVGIGLVLVPATADYRRDIALTKRLSKIVVPFRGKTKTSLGQAASKNDTLRYLELVTGPATWPRPRKLQTLVAIALVAALLSALGLLFIAKLPLGVLPLIALLVFLGSLRTLAKSDQKTVADQFVKGLPDALDIMVRNLQIGIPLDAAVARISTQGAPPISDIFSDVTQLVQLGFPLSVALSKVAAVINIQEFSFFCAAINIQSKSGGGFIEVADNLASIIRQRQGATLRGRAASSHARVTAIILTSIPVMIVVGFLLFQPEYFGPLVASKAGIWLISYATASFSIGIWVITRYLKWFERA